MNYKDPENILLIICGSTGIAALALIFRYLFIVKWGFDDFGANLVFVIIFIVGLVFFISYLEIIQKVIPPLFKRRKQTIENQDILPESDKVKDIEPTVESEPEEPIENEAPLINELDVIREKHEQDEITRKREVLEVAIQYTRTTFAPFADDQNINHLCEYVIQYSTGTELKNVEPIRVKDLQNIDLYHFGWNIWNHFRINKQDDIALFLKIVFAKNLKDVDTDTIRKKLTFSEGKRKIRLQEKL
ncbi:hypothetical protein G7051_04910 [Dysgonomonas sp. HDW5B]|uniref:hypothetical protein n=1 Tax=Dysgonomonas sp. HDW5B TaxID=2714927 RepID=UPI00140AA76D|nr:hypothetical protein [Dysgonomonas sp. HDW5B]QIK53722.1 hypothetical protein G7051_04910 [Dysgonomonas sp. HDW5B]